MRLKNLFNVVFAKTEEENLQDGDSVETDVSSKVNQKSKSPQNVSETPQVDAEQQGILQPNENKSKNNEDHNEVDTHDTDSTFDRLRDDLKHHTNVLQDALMSLKSDIAEKGGILEKQEELIRRQSQTISKFQDDLLYKVQKPLIMEMVEIADNISLILNDNDVVENKDFDSLLERVKKLADWVDASLSNNSVRRYSLTTESPTFLDRKKQEVIDVEFTDDPSKDSTYFTERPGYVWTMPYLIINSDIQLKKALEDAPKSYEFIIRPEEVVKYKYQKSEITEIN